MPKTKRHDRLAELRRKVPKITDEHGVRRVIALLFGFCGRCENDHCRRAKNCVGDGAPCFDAFWWDLPDIQKDLFREMIKARRGGAKTAAEIERRAIEAVMRHYETAEGLAAARQDGIPPQPHRAPSEPVLPPARDDTQSQSNCHTPRLTVAPSRIAYKSVIFS